MTHEQRPTHDLERAITLRPATTADAADVVRIAGRDGDPPPAEPVVVSVSEGVLIGALSLSTGQMHHDPFRATAAQRSALRAYAAFARRPRRERRGPVARLLGRPRSSSDAVAAGA